jgi:hypothetical protein
MADLLILAVEEGLDDGQYRQSLDGEKKGKVTERSVNKRLLEEKL